MINKFETFIKKYDTPVSNRSFALFRISFALFLLVFIGQVNYFRPLVFNSFLTLAPNPFPAKLFLGSWFIAAFVMMIGFKTRFAALINYLCVVIATYNFANRGCGTFNDDLLRIGSVIILFFPTHKSISVDATIHQMYNGVGFTKYTSRLYYLAAIFISLGLMYWASSITKIFSPIWQKGLGLWIPAVMPHNKWNNISLFLNTPWVMYAINYITIVWEAFFIAAIFSKRWAPVFAWAGIFFHVCIAAIFPFWLLCFGPLPFYFLFLNGNRIINTHLTPGIVYLNLKNKRQLVLSRFVKLLNPKLTTYHHDNLRIQFDGQQFGNNWDACRHILQKNFGGRGLSFLLRFEFFRLLAKLIVDDILIVKPDGSIPPTEQWFSHSSKKVSLVICGVLLLATQVFYSTYHLYKNWNKTIEVQDLSKREFHVRKSIEDVSLKPANLFRTLFGLNARGLFLDHSSVGNKVMFAVTMQNKNGETIWLPYFNQQGLVGTYNMNQMWSLYSFTAVSSGTIPNPNELEKVLTFWANKNRINTDSLDLHVLKRVYIFPTKFETNYLQQQQQLPWTLEGRVTWRNGVFTYTAADSTITTEN